jgi:uncharacterized lipoprotein YmbA
MRLRHIVIIAAALCASACASTPSSRFYMLNGMAAPGIAVVDGQNTMSLCIGPVLLADYLQRPQLCVRDNGNEVAYAEYDRWAETLDVAIPRVLVENLSRLLNTARIEVFPWKSAVPADYQVRIMVIRFDGKPKGEAVLEVRWSVEAAGQEIPVFDSISSIVEPVESKRYEDLVLAMNKAIERLSREMASVIKQAEGRNK